MRKRVHKQFPLLPLLMWLMLLALMPAQLSARDFNYTYQGQTITYSVLDEDAKTVETKKADSSLSGSLILPSTVYDGETAYTLTQIGDSTFSDKYYLSSVEIPNSVTNIGKWAFNRCDSLTSVNIPPSITAINDHTFYGCGKLKDIVLPNRVKNIDDFAFSYCSSLTNISIPDSVTRIGNSTFTNTGLTSIKIPNSVTSIGSYAFAYCRGLENADIPNSINYLGESAFESCFRVTNVNIPNSLTVINANTFRNCRLINIEIPNSVTTIGDWAFAYCEMTDVEIPNSVAHIGDYAFSECSKLTSIQLPCSLTSISEWTFFNCTALESIVIPDGVTNIGKAAFANCFSLTNVELPESVTTIGDNAFQNGRFTNIEIPSSVTYIGKGAFYCCFNLTHIVIPNSVTEIGDNAFFGCRVLDSYIFEDGLNTLKLGNQSLDSYYIAQLYLGRNWTGNFALYRVTVNELTIGNAVTEITDDAFIEAESIGNLNLGSSLKTIGANAFKNCGISELVLPPNVETVGENAFAGNDIKKIAIGSKMTEIGNKAFDGSVSLEGVSIAALTPPAATDSTFSNYDCTLLVAPGSESAYLNAASCWNRFKTQPMIAPEKVEIEGQTDLTLEPGDTIRLAASIYPANVTLPYIFWRSTNPAFATVDNEGNVTRTAEADNSGEQIHISAQADSDDAQTNQCTIIAETLYADAPIAEITIKDPSSAVTDIITDGGFERPNDVYNMQGVCLKRNATQDDVDALAPGLYIIGGKKVLVK